MRAGELWGLQAGDWNQFTKAVLIERALKDRNGHLSYGPTKTHATRTVTLPPSLAAAISAHITTGRGGVMLAPSDPLFVMPGNPSGRGRPGGGPVRHTLFLARVWHETVRATLPKERRLRFHDLRHTHASLLLAGGAQPLAVQKRLGHKTITTTMDIYGHLMPSADAQLAAMFEPPSQEEAA